MTGRYLRVKPSVIADIIGAPDMLLEVLYPEPESPDHADRYLDIDKTWHIIHFLLNGSPWDGYGPLFGCVLGGAPLTEEDLGYGPARYLSPGEVHETAAAVHEVPFLQLWKRLNPVRVQQAKLYWSDTPDSEAYARENYLSLQSFFEAASRGNEAVILWLA
jgi:hypothetical protein